MAHHVGGTHYRALVHDGVWYQTFGCSLMLFDVSTVTANRGIEQPIDVIELAEFGSAGPASDLALIGSSLFVLLEGTAVVELSVLDSWNPVIVRRIDAAALGVFPLALSVVEGSLYVSGKGGIARVRSAQELASLTEEELKAIPRGSSPDVVTILPSQDVFGGVVRTARGLATTLGRRIVSVPEQSYLGSANRLIALPQALGGPDRTAYVWVGESASVIGTMGPDLREIDRIGMPGNVRTIKAIGARLWVVTDVAVLSFAPSPDGLVQESRVDVYGAWDVEVLQPNYLAIAGSFGRAVYRMAADDRGQGDQFVSSHREASGLEESVYDGRFVLAGNVREGFWLYELERSVALADKTVMHPAEPSTSARTVAGSARIDDTGRELLVTAAGASYVFAPRDGSKLHAVVAVDDDYWVSTDRGVFILDGSATAPEIVEERTLPGPIRTMYLLRVGGGVAYVSEFGGFGVIKWTAEPIPYPKK